MGLQECLNLPFSLSLYLEEVTGSDPEAPTEFFGVTQ